MTGFTFQTVPNIVCEPGAIAQLGRIFTGLGASRVMLVSDPGLAKLGLLDGAVDSLTSAKLAVEQFTEVEADPSEATLLRAAEQARTAKVDAVLGLGGGSSMDVAKLVAFLCCSDQPLAEAYGVGNAKGSRLPLVQVPTTAGTGSEVTPISIITTGEAIKMGVVSPLIYADWAVLDADLTVGLPANVTAATGIDAMVHALEAYTTRHKKNPVSDTLARQALSLLGSNIRKVCADGTDREARSNMLLGSMLAGQAFSNAPCAAVHALAYPIGGHFHVPHGLSNSLVLTHVMRFNLPVADGMYAEVAPLAMPGLEVGETRQTAERLIDGFAQLIDDLKIEKTLRDVGIGHNHLPKLAEDAMKQQRLLINNPRDVGYDDALAIYQEAL